MNRAPGLLLAVASMLCGAVGCLSPNNGFVEQDAGTASSDAGTQVRDAGVSADAGQAADGGNGTLSGHTLILGGIAHLAGDTDPLKNCVTCHGADLNGGTAQGCYNCHDDQDHTINDKGKMHKAGVSSSCTSCHGPANAGGLGPACSSCHSDALP